MDIHSGGIDLVFPHHDNEIAQSEVDLRFVYAVRRPHLLTECPFGRPIMIVDNGSTTSCTRVICISRA
jgi:hypothetical protein